MGRIQSDWCHYKKLIISLHRGLTMQGHSKKTGMNKVKREALEDSKTANTLDLCPPE
jgi:hypothetical protein